MLKHSTRPTRVAKPW